MIFSGLTIFLGDDKKSYPLFCLCGKYCLTLSYYLTIKTKEHGTFSFLFEQGTKNCVF